MMRKYIVLLGLLAAGCSSGAPSAEQQRISALEQENAQLQGQIKEARTNIARLQAVIGRGGSADEAGQQPVGPVVPQSVDPQPDNNVGGQQPAGQSHAPQGIE